MKFTKLLILPAIALAVSCSHHPKEAEQAKARLINQDGEEVGVVSIKKDADKLKISAVFSGLEENAKQGFHVHEVGECVGDFSSAKGHFNPKGHRHGAPEEVSHAGDLGNISTDKDGTAKFSYTTDELSLNDAKNSIIGKSLIVHYGKDDFKSQPSGASGERYACGVVTAIR